MYSTCTGKDLKSRHAGLSAGQSQYKISEVEIQARRFMVSTLCPSPTITYRRG